MTYKLLVRVTGKWQEVGLLHPTFEDARSVARAQWQGFKYLVLPASV